MLNTECSNFFSSTLVENVSVILRACLHYSAGHNTKNPDITADGCCSCWNTSSSPESPI